MSVKDVVCAVTACILEVSSRTRFIPINGIVDVNVGPHYHGHFVGGASLHHLWPKFSVTGVIYYNVYWDDLVRELSLERVLSRKF